jgi:hypothetical protein
MPVTAKPVTYETSDGREFEDKDEADRHEELITARREYDEARQKFNQALVKTQKTADDEPFDFGLFRTYFVITDSWAQIPSLKRVNFLGWNFEVAEHEDQVEIIQNEGDFTNERRYGYPINRLYVSEKRAKIALGNALESWLEEQRRTVMEAKKELRGE